jgi:tetratricopeptide (TPR) repeat protein
LNKKQLIVLCGALILIVLLIIAPFSGPEISDKETADDEHGIEAHVSEFRAHLDDIQKKEIAALENNLENASGDEKIQLLDSLISTWERFGNPVMAAYYSEQVSDEFSGTERLIQTADRYYFAGSFVKDHLRQHVFEKAIAAYEKVLAAAPDNAEVKVNLAVCYVEQSGQPMKGITLLKEVLEKDSLNIKAHLNLGYFSVKSGQLDKAVERFNKVLSIDPEYIEAYLFLGDVAEMKGEKGKAIANYGIYASKTDNPALKAGAEKYIEQLRNN